MQCDNDTEMWVPADSDSESGENDELGPDFELDKKDKTEDVYSFNILDTQPVAGKLYFDLYCSFTVGYGHRESNSDAYRGILFI